MTAVAATRAELTAVHAEERELMDAWAPFYDLSQVSNALVYQLERAAFARWVGDRVRAIGGDPRTLSLLDVGCGNGQLTERLAEEGFARLIGLDLSPGMLVEAQRRELSGSLWVEGAIEDPPEGVLGVDVVVAAWVLHHMLDPRAFGTMVERALRPGGWFFVLEFDGSTIDAPGRARYLPRAAGGTARAILRRKNREALVRRESFKPRFNNVHRFLDGRGLLDALPADEYEVERVPRSAVLGALLPVLVDDSVLDRRLARCAIAADRCIGPSSGAFQWVVGRRTS